MKNTWDKQDNSDLGAKLYLRRCFLCKYHADDPPNVLDACQGERMIWSVLEKEFKLAGYWGMDRNNQKGRFKITDSARVLALPGWKQNVVDVDTYGTPWKHWLAILKNIARPLTVFLTLGRTGISSALSDLELQFIGMFDLRHHLRLRIYPGVSGALIGDLIVQIMLGHGNLNGRRVVEAKQVVSRTSSAKYFGIRILPQVLDSERVATYNNGKAGAANTGHSCQPCKEGSHV